jgi:hypothetical protein
MGRKMTGTEAGTNALVSGGLVQISRNKKINNAGSVLGIAGVILLIGELIKFSVMWLIIKPFTLIFKVFWICFKDITPVIIAFVMAIFQLLYKYIRKAFNKTKNEII